MLFVGFPPRNARGVRPKTQDHFFASGSRRVDKLQATKIAQRFIPKRQRGVQVIRRDVRAMGGAKNYDVGGTWRSSSTGAEKNAGQPR